MGLIGETMLCDKELYKEERLCMDNLWEAGLRLPVKHHRHQ